MAEYRVLVYCEGVGYIKVRAESESQAKQDAEQMAVEDIEWDSYTIQPNTVVASTNDDD